MGRVFVAGSINMDVVATADRHPQMGETVAGNAVHYFPGGKGANQAVAAAKLGAPTTLIGRLGTDAFGLQLRTFLAAQGVDISFVQRQRRSPYRNGDHYRRQCRQYDRRGTRHQCAGQRGRCRGAVLAKGDIAVSQFEIPRRRSRILQARAAVGAITILNPAPAIKFGQELLDLVDILILNETKLGLLGHQAAGNR